MQTGTKISAIAHLVAIGWVVFGASLEPDPLPFEVQEVSVISVEEYAAMVTSPQTPDVAAEPTLPAAPEATTEAPPVPVTPDTPPEPVKPEPAPQPVAETPPEPVKPEPRPEVTPPAPAPVMPTPDTATAALTPEPPAPQPRPVERVAPKPVAAPPPDAKPDEVKSPAVTPDAGAKAPQEQKEETAPEEAVDKIVTEADKPKELAPTSSPRPAARPTRPVETAAAKPEPAKPEKPAAPTATDTRSAVNDALAAALGGGSSAPAESAPAPSGPPLTSGEKEALRVAVSACWNVGSLSSAALQTTVVVSVAMQPDGKPDTGSIRLESSSGGPAEAAKQAFEAARRAIIRCGATGYALPSEKYGQWRVIEMTFNPERMRIK